MVKRCVVGGCSNTHKDKVSLHGFPKDQNFRNLWTAAVKRTRKQWDGPTKDSVICSAHFTGESYVSIQPLAEQLGLEKSKSCRLHTNAVPSLFGEKASEGTQDEPGSSDQPTTSAVVAKLDRKRVSSEVCRDVQEPGVKIQRQSSPKARESAFTVVADNATQCDLVYLPPLQLGSAANQPVLPESVPTGEPGAGHLPASPSPPHGKEPHDAPDREYTPSVHPSSSSSSSADHSPRKQVPEHLEPLYLVQESCLLSLFRERCSQCGGRPRADVSHVQGTMIRVSTVCRDCAASDIWDSQTSLSGTPSGNLRLSAAILFTGARPYKALRLFGALGCPVQTARTYMTHQRLWLHPVIQHVWSKQQGDMLRGLGDIGTGLNIGGDGRSDSPGHSAKYGSYTFLDLDWNMVLHQELVQSNEVTSSNAMELEGLKRGLGFLGQRGITIDSMVTDRHRSIAKYMREQQQDVAHYYDVWHIAKGVSKKLQQVAKKKTCADVGPWSRSISNHLYWVAASSSKDSEEAVLAKWLSVANHIQDVHDHESPHFPKCLHGDLPTTGRRKKWLKPSTEACEKAVEVVTNVTLQRDIAKLSPLHQTSDVEGFHAVIIHFAPKMTHFSYRGMKSRLLLAAMHFNENSNRPQARRKDGTEQFVVKFPKYKKGSATVCKVSTKATYDYLGELMACLMDFCRHGTLGGAPPAPVDNDPPPLAASFVHPNKEEAIRGHQSRFQKE